MDSYLAIYTLYFNPTDYPDKYVIRRFLIMPEVSYPVPDENVLIVAATRELAEEHIHKSLVWMPRHKDDDEKILGTWM